MSVSSAPVINCTAQSAFVVQRCCTLAQGTIVSLTNLSAYGSQAQMYAQQNISCSFNKTDSLTPGVRWADCADALGATAGIVVDAVQANSRNMSYSNVTTLSFYPELDAVRMGISGCTSTGSITSAGNIKAGVTKATAVVIGIVAVAMLATIM